MPLVIERLQTEGIAQLSYLVGDDSAGVAALIDPRADVDCYLELAREKKVSITHIFETHNHADLMSGARELCARLGSAKVYLSHEGDARYGYTHEAIKDGDSFEFGSVTLKAKHTPGHTYEHVSFVASEKGKHVPFAVFTGDSLFVSSAGRPDLVGGSQTEKLAEQLFDTLESFYKTLDDGVIIYPGHGAGSPCGADIGDRLESTIGYEKRFNPFLQFQDKKEFVQYAKETSPPEPTYYRGMKKMNAKGPEILHNLPIVPGLPPKTFKQAIENGSCSLIDTRLMLGFGGGHIHGAINIGGLPELSIWAGWLLDPEKALLLVLDADTKLEQIIRLFMRTGFTKFAGYLVGGMKAWDNAGFNINEINQMTVHDLAKANGTVQIIDVRSPSEWKQGHIPGAEHIFLPELSKQLRKIDRKKPKVIYCDSGYRASLAASILQKEGFTDVHNVPGSWQAWKSAKLPVVNEEKE
jgi:hydroxyacylglutathione hydrolase